MWYHGTKKENLKSIIKKGLLQTRNIKGKKKWCIYVSNNKNIAALYGNVILEIKEKETDIISTLNPQENEFMIWNNISPKRIKIL